MNANANPTTKDSKNSHGTHTAKPEAKPEAKTDTKPEASGTTTEAAEEKPKREASKVYLVVGAVMEFTNRKEAEKYLNTSPDAPKDFTVINGKKIEKKQQVSLR